MKKIFTLLLLFIFTIVTFSQPPEKMSYQAVVRNAGGELLKDSPVGMKISILQGSASGTAVYVETQSPTTNVNGLVTFEIGGGTPVTGTFAGIDWSTGTYFLKTETDPTGGTSYTIIGTSQILSVPYSFYAKTSSDAVKISGDQTINGNKTFTGTTSVSTPVNATDAVPKAYVDKLADKVNSIVDYLIEADLYYLTDIDNNRYKLVKIDNLIWMAENLKTTKYNDATPIDYPGTDNPAWQIKTSGAYAWYNNDQAIYKNIYGALYNWYAVSTGKLCPAGWRVPTDSEFTNLQNYLIANGYNFDGTNIGNKIAKSLAATTNWTTSNSSGTPGNTDFPTFRNKSGFTALPGGYRAPGYSTFGITGHFWSSTEASSTNSWHIDINYDQIDVDRMNHGKYYGFSVRCIKDY